MHESEINIYNFSKYVKYYPNKSKAIMEYRLDTGAGLKEAKEVMDCVFEQYEITGETTQSQLAHTKIQEEKEKR